ncbi:MAG: AtpZ/AtpI family protein [Alphaproteobacteria bacterium]
MPAISNAKNTGPEDDRGRDDTGERRSPDLADVEARLRRARGNGKANPGQEEAPSARSAAYRLGSDIIAGLLAGAILGWGLDQLLATSPWLLIVCMLLGFAGGVTNAIRQLQDWNRRAGQSSGGDDSSGDR